MPRLPHKKYAELYDQYDSALYRAAKLEREIVELLSTACPSGISQDKWEFAVDMSRDGEQTIFREFERSLNLAMLAAKATMPDHADSES